jgi:hypothetical protein
MPFSGTILIVAVVAVNLLTFAAFGWDKFCATSGRRRVAERTLLSLMAIGGSPAGRDAAVSPQNAKGQLSIGRYRHRVGPGRRTYRGLRLAFRRVRSERRPSRAVANAVVRDHASVAAKRV